MTGFENVHFRGTFRDYQQRVLDNAGRYLDDGKINIVAAPGSGKTVLGLELIRRLGKPCLILSPTTTIRQQWGERFGDMFLDNADDCAKLVSYDLHEPKLINSVTYQALYTAVEKKAEAEVDCSDVDIFAALKEHGIKTVCLDEAHHLKNEWQMALEKFVGMLDSDVKLISLTATPPYDSESGEWKRYTSLCGEIDEEIFIPELVGRNTLCPHQDYVFFNYPTPAEAEGFTGHRERAIMAVEELATLDFFESLNSKLSAERDNDRLFSDAKGYIALMVLLRHYGFEPNRRLVRLLTVKKGLPKFSLEYAERAVQFLLSGDLLDDEQKERIVYILKSHSVYEKRKVTFLLTDKQKRTLISSVGKLESIGKIAVSESRSMGEQLRMLVLTDYIKKESVAAIAAADGFSSISVVSIFETLRRSVPHVRIGVLSGSLIILPKSIDLSDVSCKTADIPNTNYCTVEFSGSLSRAVAFVGKLFEEGRINILVGTKSLLGEGWDSPCVNSLVLASFVGSFVLSNQMRGRAIRIDPNAPDKVANIWHLVTLEPEYLFADSALERMTLYLSRGRDMPESYDFGTVKRRFDTFMGPNYTTGVIESGIERITAIKPPFDRKGVERINGEMLELAADRAAVRDKWSGETSDGRFTIEVEAEVPPERRVPVFTFYNTALVMLLLFVQMPLVQAFINSVKINDRSVSIITLAAVAVSLYVLYLLIKTFIIHANPARSIKALGTAVFRTLCGCGLISPAAKVETEADNQLGCITLRLRNATVREQNIFNTAMTEMLTPIDNPRYIIIAKTRLGSYRYAMSFACPAVIGKKKEYAQALAENLKRTTGRFEPVYTRSDSGRQLILKCRRRSYITYNEKTMNRKFKVSHFE